MRDDQKKGSIVEGPEPFRWPWQRARDVEIGVKSHDSFGGSKASRSDSTIDKPGSRQPAVSKLRIARRGADIHVAAATANPGLKSLPVQFVVLVALVYHLLGPAAAFLTGTDLGARGLLTFVDGVIPPVFDIDISRWLIPGAAAWMWQPLLAVGGAALLRLTALNTARRDPLSAIWIGVAAAIVDTATWLFVGLKLWGTAFTPEEGAALITLLKVEGGALLVLFFIFAPTGRRRLGKTDAEWQGDN